MEIVRRYETPYQIVYLNKASENQYISGIQHKTTGSRTYRDFYCFQDAFKEFIFNCVQAEKICDKLEVE